MILSEADVVNSFVKHIQKINLLVVAIGSFGGP